MGSTAADEPGCVDIFRKKEEAMTIARAHVKTVSGWTLLQRDLLKLEMVVSTTVKPGKSEFNLKWLQKSARTLKCPQETEVHGHPSLRLNGNPCFENVSIVRQMKA